MFCGEFQRGNHKMHILPGVCANHFNRIPVDQVRRKRCRQGARPAPPARKLLHGYKCNWILTAECCNEYMEMHRVARIR